MLTIRFYTIFVITFILFSVSCDHKKNSVSGNDQSENSEDYDSDIETITDADGNKYKTIKIGNQVWTAEDLRTTKYNDGTKIPHVVDSAEWVNLTSPGYSFYKNSTDPNKNQKYGALYNWYAVNTNKLSPSGWHVPTNSDWETLRDYLISHGYNFDNTTSGNKIAKSLAAKSDWRSFDIIGTVGNDLQTNNKTGFNAYPNGSRYSTRFNDFANMGLHTHYWSSSQVDNNAYSIYITYDSSSVATHVHPKNLGFTVRLVKDK